ncbi:hypothetical protein O9929_01955 [Vibrio lentus]|nr:hypothetical protein [Vibrio lentus]
MKQQSNTGALKAMLMQSSMQFRYALETADIKPQVAGALTQVRLSR